VAVSVPGRLDSEAGREEQADFLNYAGPAGYAFAIWGAIYITEAVFVVWMLAQLCLGVPDRRLAMVIAASPGWLAGNVAQVLWCITYRPWLNTAATIWISATMLSATAVGLSFAHGAVAAQCEGCQEQGFMLAPITLHFGWTTAAALVNWNRMASYLYNPTLQVVAVSLSLVAASIIGAGVSYVRRAPGYVCTVAWAVTAIGVRTFQMQEEFAEELGASGASMLATAQLATGLGLWAFGIGWKVLACRSGK